MGKTKRRAQKALLEQPAAEEAQLRRRGLYKAATAVRGHAQAHAALIRKVTQHWFRPRLATSMPRKDRARPWSKAAVSISARSSATATRRRNIGDSLWREWIR